MQDLDDQELLSRFRSDHARGESGGRWVDELFRRYQTRVATWCLRFTGDRESAGDLAQEIFLLAFRNLRSFEGSAKFSTWLYTVARNHCMNTLRSKQSQTQRASESLDFDVEDHAAASVLDAMEQNESLELMRSLIEHNLDPIEKKVMVMHFANGISLDSVSRLLGLTNASGARAHIVSAKRKLTRARARWEARIDK